MHCLHSPGPSRMHCIRQSFHVPAYTCLRRTMPSLQCLCLDPTHTDKWPSDTLVSLTAHLRYTAWCKRLHGWCFHAAACTSSLLLMSFAEDHCVCKEGPVVLLTTSRAMRARGLKLEPLKHVCSELHRMAACFFHGIREPLNATVFVLGLEISVSFAEIRKLLAARCNYFRDAGVGIYEGSLTLIYQTSFRIPGAHGKQEERSYYV